MMVLVASVVAAVLLVLGSGPVLVVAAPGPVAMIPVPGAGASYWPRWRGASGQGTVAGTSYVDVWSPTVNVR